MRQMWPILRLIQTRYRAMRIPQWTATTHRQKIFFFSAKSNHPQRQMKVYCVWHVLALINAHGRFHNKKSGYSRFPKDFYGQSYKANYDRSLRLQSYSDQKIAFISKVVIYDRNLMFIRLDTVFKFHSISDLKTRQNIWQMPLRLSFDFK